MHGSGLVTIFVTGCLATHLALDSSNLSISLRFFQTIKNHSCMTEIGGQLCAQAVNRGSDLSATMKQN